MKSMLRSFTTAALTAAVLLLGGCPKGEQTDVSGPDNVTTNPDEGSGMRPVVAVPSINEYGWLAKANIKIANQSQYDAVKNKVEDYYSGYPSFLKVLKLITRDRNVGLKDNPAYLTDVFDKYYEMAGADPADPYLAVTDYDTGVLKNALFLSWKKQNEFSNVDNYDDMVTNVNFGD
jgi:hypothetical protein